jgi:hypothetical protein
MVTWGFANTWHEGWINGPQTGDLVCCLGWLRIYYHCWEVIVPEYNGVIGTRN